MSHNQKRKAIEQDAILNMTPMIDVTFQLLIFFIVTLRFRVLEKKLDSYLPTDYGLRPGSPIDEDFLDLSLRQVKSHPEGQLITQRATRYSLAGRVVAESTSGPAALLELERRIARFRRSVPDAQGRIDAGMGVPHGRVVEALDLFHRCGYSKVTFTGLTKTSELTKNPASLQRLRSALSSQ